MIFRAPEADLVIPDVALTPFLLERTAALGDKPAFIDGPTGRTLTYRGWADAVRKAAAGLACARLPQGRCLCHLQPQPPRVRRRLPRGLAPRRIVTTINPPYTASELRQQLEDAGARALVTVPPCLDKAAHAAREAGVREVFVFGEAERRDAFCALLDADADPPPSRSTRARRSWSSPTRAAPPACRRA